MKVGFDAKRIFHNNTGLGNYGRDVIRILHGHEPIDEFVLYNTKPAQENKLKILDRFSVEYPKNWFWRKIPSLWRLGRVTKQILNDCVTIYHGLSGELPLGLKENEIPSIVTIHDLIFLSHPQYYSFFDRVIYKKKFLHAAKNSDTIIAISEQTKRDIIKYGKVDSEKIKVVYQGCNDAYKKEYDTASKEKVIEKYKLPEKFVLNVGTLQERKNALTIVKAIRGTDQVLILVGSQKKYAKKIQAYIVRHNLQSQVRFLKNVPVNELAIIYQLATVFCYPSVCEGFGIPIIEALFSKTPVITSTGSCFSEAGGPSSIYIEPHDDRALRQRLKLLFDSPSLRGKMQKEGYAFVQRFNDQVVAKNIFGVYQDVFAHSQNNRLNSLTEKNKITALLITFNEIAHIDSVLNNLDFVDEIIVVDSYSTDGTVDSIRKHPKVKLVQRPFENYTDQKSFALQQASHDWVLFIDADERITVPLKNEIFRTIDSEEPAAAYYFYRTFMFQNKVLRFSGWQSDKNYRLFRKSKVHFAIDRIVHETLVVDGRSDVLKRKLVHYSYKNYDDYKAKMIKYGQMKAQEELIKGYRPNLYHFILKPTYKFLNHYIIRLGVLDGRKGLTICYLNALSVFSRYKELKRLRLMELP